MAISEFADARARWHVLTMRDVLPLIGYLVPTLATAYGIVMPRHGIAGVNELTIGFGSAVVGACITYVVGLRAALARRAASDGGAAHRGRRPELIARQSARPHGFLGCALGRIMRAETRAANNAASRPPTPPNLVPIVELNKAGDFPASELTELEAGANRWGEARLSDSEDQERTYDKLLLPVRECGGSALQREEGRGGIAALPEEGPRPNDQTPR